MTKMTGSKALIKSLENKHVDVMFGILGGALLPVYDALCDSKIRHILTRHEQDAAHMADGFARASGKPGVCMATSGPGATNLVTGIANAYMDSSPIIALTGQVPTIGINSSYMIGKDAFQEADIVGITTPITKHNYQVRDATDIPKTINTAFLIATTGRPGPVLVDLPKNIQSEQKEIELTDEIDCRGYKPTVAPNPMQISRAVDLLAHAERPLLLAGGGVISSNASAELKLVAELLMAPVATSLMGKGCFPEIHPLSVGSIGMHGNPAANKLVGEADVVLAVGTRFSDRSSANLDSFCPEAKRIHIDIDAAEIGKNIDVEVPIVSDAKPSLQMIYEGLTTELKKRKPGQAWVNRIKEAKETLSPSFNCDDSKELKARNLIASLRSLLPDDAIVTTEVGQNQMWSALYYKALQPRSFITSGGLGTMGFGFPASLGAKVACPDRPVLDIAGDGSFLMTEHELACSVEENIPVTVIVLNNSVLGMVAQWQRMLYNRRYMAVKLGKSPDFVKLAQAYGANGVRVGSSVEFQKAVKEALKSEVSTVIDVPISPEEDVVPFVPPGCGLPQQKGEY